MTAHPVQLHVERTTHIPRSQVLIRLVLALALGTLGWTSIYWLLYLEVPALVALAIWHQGSERYLSETGPRLVLGLHWFAGALAYLCFLTDAMPVTRGGPVDLRITIGAEATPRAAFARLVLALPALLLVAALALAGTFAWPAAAALTLVKGRVPGPLADFFEVLVRTELRLGAYHLSLVDRYPSLEDAGSEAAFGV